MSTDEGGAMLSSLCEVFRVLRTPVENRRVVEAFTTAIGIREYRRRVGYVLAIRRAGGPDLRIGYGWANGFTSEEEIRAITGGGLEVWESDERAPLWGLWLPVNRAHAGGGTRTPRRGAVDARGRAVPVDPDACSGPTVLGRPCGEPAVDEVGGARLCTRHAGAARVEARMRALFQDDDDS